MKNNLKSNITTLKPICYGCGLPLTRPTLKHKDVEICIQCFTGNHLYWQNYMEGLSVKRQKPSVQGGLIHESC